MPMKPVEHARCMQILLPILCTLGVQSLLDAGCATVRGLPTLAEGLSGALVCGARLEKMQRTP